MDDGVVELLLLEIYVVVVFIPGESVLVDLVDGSVVVGRSIDAFVVVVLVLLRSVIIGVGFVVETRASEVAVAIVFASDTSVSGDLVDEGFVDKSGRVLSVIGSVDVFIGDGSMSVE